MKKEGEFTPAEFTEFSGFMPEIVYACYAYSRFWEVMKGFGLFFEVGLEGDSAVTVGALNSI